MPVLIREIPKLVVSIAMAAGMASTQPKALIDAGQQFEVASIKLNKTNDQPFSNFPLGPGDVYVPNGGLFSARGIPLVTYLFFAYKIIGNQGQYLLPQLPEWAKTDRYDIQARAGGSPGKEQMRMMMRTLLGERFGLRMHSEMREVAVLAFVLAKPGKMGPQLWPHSDGGDCPTQAAPATKGPVARDARGLPALCNGIFVLPPSAAGRIKLGARSITLQFLADSLSAGANPRTSDDRPDGREQADRFSFGLCPSGLLQLRQAPTRLGSFRTDTAGGVTGAVGDKTRICKK